MKFLSDYTHIRGVNYSMTSPEVARKQLAYGRRIGLNSVRFWLSPYLYFQDPKGYVEQVQTFVRTCYECGYSTPSQFIKMFKRHEGITPSTYRKESHTTPKRE